MIQTNRVFRYKRGDFIKKTKTAIDAFYKDGDVIDCDTDKGKKQLENDVEKIGNVCTMFIYKGLSS